MKAHPVLPPVEYRPATYDDGRPWICVDYPSQPSRVFSIDECPSPFGPVIEQVALRKTVLAWERYRADVYVAEHDQDLFDRRVELLAMASAILTLISMVVKRMRGDRR